MAAGNPAAHIELGTAGDLLQINGRLDFARQVWVVKLVAERMRSLSISSRYSPPKETRAGGEVSERHLKAATDFRVEVVDLQVNPLGGSHLALASASRNAR